MVWPFQASCKTLTDEDDMLYELILGINDNRFIKRFWCKSRLRRTCRRWPDSSYRGKHDLHITISYSVDGQLVSGVYKKEGEGKQITWKNTLSGGFAGPLDPLTLQLIEIDVTGSVERDGKRYALTCKKQASR